MAMVCAAVSALIPAAVVGTTIQEPVFPDHCFGMMAAESDFIENMRIASLAPLNQKSSIRFTDEVEGSDHWTLDAQIF